MRFERYTTRYKNALQVKNMTWGSLSAIEARARVTIAMKLKKMCPRFERIHILLVEIANVNPPQLGVVGLPKHLEVYHKFFDHDLVEDFLHDSLLDKSKPIENIAIDDEEGLTLPIKAFFTFFVFSAIYLFFCHLFVFSSHPFNVIFHVLHFSENPAEN